MQNGCWSSCNYNRQHQVSLFPNICKQILEIIFIFWTLSLFILHERSSVMHHDPVLFYEPEFEIHLARSAAQKAGECSLIPSGHCQCDVFKWFTKQFNELYSNNYSLCIAMQQNSEHYVKPKKQVARHGHYVKCPCLFLPIIIYKHTHCYAQLFSTHSVGTW